MNEVASGSCNGSVSIVGYAMPQSLPSGSLFIVHTRSRSPFGLNAIPNFRPICAWNYNPPQLLNTAPLNRPALVHQQRFRPIQPYSVAPNPRAFYSPIHPPVLRSKPSSQPYYLQKPTFAAAPLH